MKIRAAKPEDVQELVRPQVFTDGGPWATHNFPCPVCWEHKAMLNLAGWVAEPCRGCTEEGWALSYRKLHDPWWKRWLRGNNPQVGEE